MHPNYDSLKNPSYFNGYTSEAKRIRTRKAWNKYIGFAIDVGIAGIVYWAILVSNNQKSKRTTTHWVIPGF